MNYWTPQCYLGILALDEAGETKAGHNAVTINKPIPIKHQGEKVASKRWQLRAKRPPRYRLIPFEHPIFSQQRTAVTRLGSYLHDREGPELRTYTGLLASWS